jgi:23S rRNA (adenine2030-N6)-methyltransferase
MLWYPILPEARHRPLLRQVEGLAAPKTRVSEYAFSASASGLQGSGLVIVNTPWHFDEELDSAMQYVIDVFGSGTHSIKRLD